MSLPLGALRPQGVCTTRHGDGWRCHGPALMAVSLQGTTVLTVTAMDRDTGVNDEIYYSITSE